MGHIPRKLSYAFMMDMLVLDKGEKGSKKSPGKKKKSGSKSPSGSDC